MSSRRLAIRALNEARRTDPLAYLSLRFTAETTLGIQDRWAREIAPMLVSSADPGSFVASRQFKELQANGTPEFRDVRFCGGPQQLAEAALIEACSLAGGPFIPSKSVYSYLFESRHGSEGIFRPYFELFSKRQDDIGKRCRQYTRNCVVYLDIKRFYPSIKFTRIRKAWNRACGQSGIDKRWRELGNRLIDQQFAVGSGLLVGPQFSHVLANLLMRDFDNTMERLFPLRYFRYVDDFAFVVKFEEMDALIETVSSHLRPLVLKLNPEKTQWMGASKWESNAPYQTPDYADDNIGDADWMHFIDNLKCYLTRNPGDGPILRDAFTKENLRVPVPRYESAIQEEVYQQGFERRRKIRGFEESALGISSASLVETALNLRVRYVREFFEIWPEFHRESGLLRKWKKSRLRYLIGRCLLVASMDELTGIHEALNGASEFAEYSAMLDAMVNRHADSLLRFGWKPAAAVAPAIAAGRIALKCAKKRWSEENLEAYTALRLGSVAIDGGPSAKSRKSCRYYASMGRFQSGDWVKEKDPFYREFLSLAGSHRFEEFLLKFQTPIDPAENLAAFSDELLGLNPT